MATARVLLDTTQYVRVTDRFDIIWLQCLRDTVRIVFSNDKPSRNNTTFHLIAGDDPMMEFDNVDTSIWALATTPESTLIITNVSNLPKTFASVVNVSIPAKGRYSLRIEKNSSVAVQRISAPNITILAKKGDETGQLVQLAQLVSSDGLNDSLFTGVLEVYDGPATGDTLFADVGLLDQEFYPDGNYAIELYNPSDVTVDTHVAVTVRQITITGVYVILEPTTQLEPTTEMSVFNGTN